MRYLYLLLFLLLTSTPLYAEQALVLTEIEQIQEKIWYLQRDLAASQKSLKNQQENLGKLDKATSETNTRFGARLDTLEQSTTSLQLSLQQLQAQLQQLNETLFELSENAGQKDNTIIDMAGKTGALEGSLQALRKELASQQARHDKAVGELRGQQEETRAQLAVLQEKGAWGQNQLSLWIGAGVLGFAVLLTLFFALRGGRKKEREDTYTNHQL